MMTKYNPEVNLPEDDVTLPQGNTTAEYQNTIGGSMFEELAQIMSSPKAVRENKLYDNQTEVAPVDQGESMELKRGNTTLKYQFEALNVDISVIRPAGATNVLEMIAGPDYGFNQRTTNLFMMITREFYKGRYDNDGQIKIPFNEYMELCGLKDRKSARAQVRKALLVLFNTWIKFDGSHPSLQELNRGIVIGGGNYGLTKGPNPQIYFTINPKFRRALGLMTPTQRSAVLYSINPTYNPHSLPLEIILSEHQKMNKGKPNANHIRTATLLSRITIITEKELKSKEQSRRNYIMRPFIRDMNKLKELGVLNYWYLEIEGTLVKKDDELAALDFDTFKNSICHFQCAEPNNNAG